MHEIVTLQFGQQSNYLGTHFWNTQESYFTYDNPEGGDDAAVEPSPVDHDIHFRPGVGADGSDTFMPRTVIYDLKGAFGSLRKINALYEPEDGIDAQLWPGSTITHRATAIPPSEYQQALDAGLQAPKLTPETVRYWSDYSRVYYHPKSLVQLHEYELQSQLMPFEGWDVGEELFAGLDKEHDLLDRDLRPFIEECDQLQGLQIMSSVDDAWGGFSSSYVERLRDEFGKLSIWVWALEEEEKKARDKKLLQLTNKARSIHALSPQSSAYIPVSALPTNNPASLASSFDASSRWHTAALQAAAVESMTLPSRLRAGATRRSLAEMEATFDNGGNRRVVELQMSVADPEALSKKLEDAVEAERERERERQDAASKGRKAAASAYEGLDYDDGDSAGGFDMEFSRFGPEQLSGRVGAGARKRVRLFGRAESLRGDWELDEKIEAQNRAARDRFANKPMVQRYRVPLLFPVLDSYPHIFSVGGTTTKQEKLAIQTALTTTSGISDRLRQMGTLVGRLVGIEQREDLSNGLKTLADEYEEGWDSGLEDSDDDDE